MAQWAWGDSVLPHFNYYSYLGVKFTCNGDWDAHLKDLVTSGKCKLNSLLRILCNPSLSLYLRRQVIFSILISKGWRTFGDFRTLKVTGHQRKA